MKVHFVKNIHNDNFRLAFNIIKRCLNNVFIVLNIWFFFCFGILCEFLRVQHQIYSQSPWLFNDHSQWYFPWMYTQLVRHMLAPSLYITYKIHASKYIHSSYKNEYFFLFILTFFWFLGDFEFNNKIFFFFVFMWELSFSIAVKHSVSLQAVRGAI